MLVVTRADGLRDDKQFRNGFADKRVLEAKFVFSLTE